MAKLITVFGATGQQGGAVARALLAKDGFQVRVVTRNPDSEKAKALKAAGAEVVKADFSDVASVETAVQGAYGAFFVTDYWSVLGKVQEGAKVKDAEFAQGKVVGDACKKAGVKHVVYSGMESSEDIMGKPVPRMDSKAAVEKYLDEIGIPNTSVRYPFYFENFANMVKPQKQDDGTYVVTLSMDGPMYAIGVEDGGPIVASIFTNPDEFVGKKVGIAGDRLTLQEYLDVLTKLTGKTFKYNQVTPEQLAQLPIPAAEETATMFEFMTKHLKRDLALTKRLNPAVRNFAQWATDNKHLFTEDD